MPRNWGSSAGSGPEVEDPVVNFDETRHVGRKKAARQALITRTVSSQGFVDVDVLADTLGVSRMTIHRDLDDLQDAGFLRKVRGGATAERSTQFESELSYRAASAVAEKRAIGQLAASLINDGDVVLLDDSTTTLHTLPHLVTHPQLTVITNYLLAMERLRDVHQIRLIALGGEFIPRYAGFFGMVCEDNLADVHADVLLASTSSLRDDILYHQDQRVAKAKRAMIACSDTRVLLVDHTKFGRAALHKVCELKEFNYVVVDSRIDTATLTQVETLVEHVLVAPSQADL